jgi:hypothetical protein
MIPPTANTTECQWPGANALSLKVMREGKICRRRHKNSVCFQTTLWPFTDFPCKNASKCLAICIIAVKSGYHAYFVRTTPFLLFHR